MFFVTPAAVIITVTAAGVKWITEFCLKKSEPDNWTHSYHVNLFAQICRQAFSAMLII